MSKVYLTFLDNRGNKHRTSFESLVVTADPFRFKVKGTGEDTLDVSPTLAEQLAGGHFKFAVITVEGADPDKVLEAHLDKVANDLLQSDTQ